MASPGQRQGGFLSCAGVVPRSQIHGGCAPLVAPCTARKSTARCAPVFSTGSPRSLLQTGLAGNPEAPPRPLKTKTETAATRPPPGACGHYAPARSSLIARRTKSRPLPYSTGAKGLNICSGLPSRAPRCRLPSDWAGLSAGKAWRWTTGAEIFPWARTETGRNGAGCEDDQRFHNELFRKWFGSRVACGRVEAELRFYVPQRND